MHIRQIDRSELNKLASDSCRQWLAAALQWIADLPDHPHGRILVALEEGQVRAVLGLELSIDLDERSRTAVIRGLTVSPEHGRRGIGSRLVRFAEGIAHVNGCPDMYVVPELVAWGDGRCWPSLGYGDPSPGLRRDIAQRFRQCSA